LLERFRSYGNFGLLALVGVQSNQFPVPRYRPPVPQRRRPVHNRRISCIGLCVDAGRPRRRPRCVPGPRRLDVRR
jgi:hypothetical protein